ncbi:Piso0_003360 protein [Mycolicibacterium thermoresistibile]|uniref:Piso0_003360 protein n=1 Tax=Mycolicibacterium thermoresistibile TaxID=1797 RepID=A0A100XIS4_MYCTH|nr:Piso0_003360 protein [Mycolicibacterium thermoresistibile]
MAQSRSCTAVGTGTSNTTAANITIPPASMASRCRGTCAVVVTTAARTARKVLTTVFTSTKGTARWLTNGVARWRVEVTGHGPRKPII